MFKRGSLSWPIDDGADEVAGNGSVDNLAEGEEDAIAQAKRFLSYLPSSVYEAPPVLPADPALTAESGGALIALPRCARSSP